MNNDPIKLLLVEDDEDDFIVTRDLLSDVKGKTYIIEWVSRCDEAFNVIESKEYDIILLDYRLGKMTGISLMRQAIDSGCTMPFILLTDQDSQETDLEAMEAGASDYLVKGEFNTAMLERAIRYAIEQKTAEAQIRKMAFYDNLTKLPNRVLFRDNLKYALEQCNRYKRMAAVLFIDVDNFKRVNATFGQAVGDELLQGISELLIRSVRLSDAVSRNVKGDEKEAVARFGEDEFMILLTEIDEAKGAEKVAERILEGFNTPILLGGREVFVRASIGIAICPTDGTDGDTMH